jgi:hypothetical protein
VKVRFIANARRLWFRFWSVRLALLAALLSAVDVAFQFYATGQPSWVVLGALIINLSAAGARVIAQDSLADDYANAP